MHIVCLDLEGVLAPEIWINVAAKTGIEELKLTTRDIEDYDELMHHRLKVMAQHDVRLSLIQEVIGGLDPLPGAREFLDWLRRETQVVILSDTFSQFALPIMEKLNWPTLFCHELIVTDDRITGYKLRTENHKAKSVAAFKLLNFTTIAAGDSFNDVTMLHEADHGILFKTTEAIRAQFPQFPATDDYARFRELIAERLAGRAS